MERRALLLLVAVFVFAVDILSVPTTARANTKVRIGFLDFTSNSGLSRSPGRWVIFRGKGSTWKSAPTMYQEGDDENLKH